MWLYGIREPGGIPNRFCPYIRPNDGVSDEHRYDMRQSAIRIIRERNLMSLFACGKIAAEFLWEWPKCKAWA
jgi:lipopolysaccharide biosynthesis regulator YciM